MVVIADLHLGKVQDTVEKDGLPSRIFDVRARVREAIKNASSRKDSLIIAGDIFDTPYPQPYLIDLFIGLMEEASKSVPHTVLIPGNHDCGIHYTSLTYMEGLLPGVQLITAPFYWPQERTVFLPHVPKDQMEAMVKKYGSYLNWALHDLEKFSGKIKCVIGHAHLSGAKNASEVELEAGEAIHFKASDFFKYKLGIFGHIHRHQIIGKNIYCGPVVTNSFDEADLEKGMVVAGEDSVDFVRFKTPETPYRKVTINLVDKDSIDLSEKTLEKIGKGKLLKVVVYARSLMQVHEAEIRDAFNKAGGNVVRFETVLCDQMGSVDDSEVESVVEDINYQSVFASWLQSKKLSSKESKLVLTLGKEIIEEVVNAQRAEG